MRTVFWNGGKVAMVDRTAPPGRVVLIETDDVERVALAIRRREVRGAPAAAVAAAYALALAALRSPAICADGVLADVEEARRVLSEAGAGGGGLQRSLDRMTAFARARAGAGTEGFAEAVLAEAERIAERELGPGARDGSGG